MQIFQNSDEENQRPTDKEKIKKFLHTNFSECQRFFMPSWLCKKKKLALSGLLKEIENYGVNVAHHGQFNGTCDFFPQFYLRGKLSVVIKHNVVKSYLRDQ
jgi:hypothetical protein